MPDIFLGMRGTSINMMGKKNPFPYNACIVSQYNYVLQGILKIIIYLESIWHNAFPRHREFTIHLTVLNKLNLPPLIHNASFYIYYFYTHNQVYF